MSYAAGAATFGAIGGNAGVDVKMPSAIKSEIVTVATQIAALGKVIDGASSKLPADFLTGWAAFKAEWNTFAQAHQSWLSRTWYASYEKTVEYRKRLEDWRQQFTKITGQAVNFPSPGATPEGMSPSGEGFPWRKIIYGGLIVGGIYGIAKVFREARGIKHDVVGERPLIGGHHHHHEAAA